MKQGSFDGGRVGFVYRMEKTRTPVLVPVIDGEPCGVYEVDGAFMMYDNELFYKPSEEDDRDEIFISMTTGKGFDAHIVDGIYTDDTRVIPIRFKVM